MDMPLRNLIEEISNKTIYKNMLWEMRIDESQMPISNINKETLNKAKLILSSIH